MATICGGITRSGSRCSVAVGPGKTHCYLHDSSKAEERRRAASRAGRSRPNSELKQIKADLQGMVDSLLAGELDRGVASVAAQLINVRLRAVEVERRSFDAAQIAERLDALEQRAARLRGT